MKVKDGTVGGEKNEKQLVGCTHVTFQATSNKQRNQGLSSVLLLLLRAPADIQEAAAGGEASVKPAAGGNPWAD